MCSSFIQLTWHLKRAYANIIYEHTNTYTHFSLLVWNCDTCMFISIIGNGKMRFPISAKSHLPKQPKIETRQHAWANNRRLNSSPKRQITRKIWKIFHRKLCQWIVGWEIAENITSISEMICKERKFAKFYKEMISPTAPNSYS